MGMQNYRENKKIFSHLIDAIINMAMNTFEEWLVENDPSFYYWSEGFMRDWSKKAMPFALTGALAASSLFSPQAHAQGPAPTPSSQVSSSELAEKTAQIKEMVSSAKTPAERREMAMKLFQVANDESSPEVKNMILTTAKGLAYQAGPAITVQDSKEMAQHTMKMFDAAIAADDFKSARQLGAMLTQFAYASKDAELSKTAQTKVRDIQDISNAFDQVKLAMDKLVVHDNDPAANLTVGKYNAFIKGDWEKGLPYLAKSGDKDVSSAANLEITGPTETAKSLELADGWWKVAEKERTVAAQKNVKAHASAIYAKIVGELTGIDKARAEKRMSDGVVSGITQSNIAGKWKFIHARGSMSWDFSPNGTVTASPNVDGVGKWAINGKTLKIVWAKPGRWHEFDLSSSDSSANGKSWEGDTKVKMEKVK